MCCYSHSERSLLPGPQLTASIKYPRTSSCSCHRLCQIQSLPTPLWYTSLSHSTRRYLAIDFWNFQHNPFSTIFCDEMSLPASTEHLPEEIAFDEGSTQPLELVYISVQWVEILPHFRDIFARTVELWDKILEDPNDLKTGYKTISLFQNTMPPPDP
ncbi:hypothetical protein BV25DRAFT_123507 [Artomyces pyxidatus]|uniref:Uncharacterized protein n=1 Tax=Artomyces pyxidatus TaxID=48021 RepID=A0ACB8TLG7_9AGAM|nr:hypothetical protein BV25DRAFT_123507 [Artomyces pyxidatus]